MKFSEIEYKRPDIEKAKEFFASAAERLAAAGSFEEAERVFLEVEDYSAAVGSMLTVANIRHDIDTRDEFYDAESAFIDAAGPELTEYEQRWNEAMLKTPFRARFEEKYNRLMFLNTEIDLRTFSPEIVPEMQKENALVSEYSKLLASAQIPFEGREWTLSQLSPVKQDPDEARRAAAWAAEDSWYTERQPRLDAIYAELVGLRDAMGRKLGYENFIPLGYDRMQRNCYAKEDVERFRAAVREYIVPIAEQVYSRVAARLGKTLPMGYADCAMWYTDGNAKPVGTPEEIMENGRRFYHELSGETAEFIDFMFERGLFDVLSRPGKAGGGYCTTLTAWKMPFIFANFNGTSGDVEVITHEAGHAFASYTARDIVPRAERLALARGLRGALDEHGVLRRGLGGALLRPGGGQIPLAAPGRRHHLHTLRHARRPLPARVLRAPGVDAGGEERALARAPAGVYALAEARGGPRLLRLGPRLAEAEAYLRVPLLLHRLLPRADRRARVLGPDQRRTAPPPGRSTWPTPAPPARSPSASCSRQAGLGDPRSTAATLQGRGRGRARPGWTLQRACSEIRIKRSGNSREFPDTQTIHGLQSFSRP